jgi:hypothetical protein
LTHAATLIYHRKTEISLLKKNNGSHKKVNRSLQKKGQNRKVTQTRKTMEFIDRVVKNCKQTIFCGFKDCGDSLNKNEIQRPKPKFL